MDSSSPPLLKNKLMNIKLLLDDANHRLQDEADIFTTKTSASVHPMKPNQNGQVRHHTQHHHLPPAELRRTIADISTIQSVLSCPIFNQIANVTDSLDRLTYHLNLRPSIGPGDIEFNDNGELILAPPVEPATLNNFINSQLDDQYSSTPNSPQQQQNNRIVTRTQAAHEVAATAVASAHNGNDANNSIEHQFNAQHQQQNASNYYTEFAKHQSQNNEIIMNMPSGSVHEPQPLACNQNYANQQTAAMPQAATAAAAIASQQQQHHRRNEYDTEKLLATDAGQGMAANYANGARRGPSKVQSVAAVFENAISTGNEAAASGRGLHKANGHAALNQMSTHQQQQPNSADTRMDFETTRSMSQINEQSMGSESSATLGYTNELYKTAHEVANANQMETDQFIDQKSGGVYANGAQQQPQPLNKQHEKSETGAAQNGKPHQNGRATAQRVSPSISAGSTVRLADECDSGTSSFRSKGALYSPQLHKPIAQLDEDPTLDSGMDQELIEKLSPDMERIKVTLEKDSSGLGITIAGYTCEQEEISGIFIKSVTPGSPADRSGKIRILDQIFAVNGQEILGFSNPEAVNVLRRQTSRIVTLDLMRYLAESKYKKLQTLLEHAAPSANLQKASSAQMTNSSDGTGTQPTTKAQPVVSSAASPKRTEPQPIAQPSESMYNNTSAFIKAAPAREQLDGGGNATSPIPVAAQRSVPATASKVIETKQGARNKIDIRSPLTQTTTTATYVNEIAADPNNYTAPTSVASNTKSITERLRQELADDFCRTEKLEWVKNVQIVELVRRDSTQSLGFSIKEYAHPKNPEQTMLMIVSITPDGIADQSGQLAIGDLLMFVDDTNVENQPLSEAVKALRKASDQVRLGILKYKRN